MEDFSPNMEWPCNHWVEFFWCERNYLSRESSSILYCVSSYKFVLWPRFGFGKEIYETKTLESLE